MCGPYYVPQNFRTPSVAVAWDNSSCLKTWLVSVIRCLIISTACIPSGRI